MYAKEATKYEKIFSGTHWGNFKIEKNQMITNEIIENRNKFVEEYNIKSISNIPQYIKKVIKEEREMDIY